MHFFESIAPFSIESISLLKNIFGFLNLKDFASQTVFNECILMPFFCFGPFDILIYSDAKRTTLLK
jgi:hypothetical protein